MCYSSGRPSGRDWCAILAPAARRPPCARLALGSGMLRPPLFLKFGKILMKIQIQIKILVKMFDKTKTILKFMTTIVYPLLGDSPGLHFGTAGFLDASRLAAAAASPRSLKQIQIFNCETNFRRQNINFDTKTRSKRNIDDEILKNVPSERRPLFGYRGR